MSAIQPPRPGSSDVDARTVVVPSLRGLLLGERRSDVAVFRGIPYAEPPFGSRRFGAPEPARSWPGVRDCRAFSVAAPKPGQPEVFETLLPDASPWGEDCLTLNIWTPLSAVAGHDAEIPVDPEGPGPDTEAPAALPVILWVPGGGYVTGSGAVDIYDGSAFARHGVVMVTINYRLGVDGFSSLPDAVANRGLLDVIEAGRWVRECIGAFGGDPDTVTLAGQSAGAMAVTSVLTMPAARGLFRRAIAMSGAGHHALPTEVTRLVTDEVAAELGVAPTAAAFGSVPLAEVVAATDAIVGRLVGSADPRWDVLRRTLLTFCPEIEPETLPQLPIDAIAAGVGNEVDLLIGTVSDEFALWAVPTGVAAELDEDGLRAALRPLGVDPDTMIARYQRDDPTTDPGRLYIRILTDWHFRIPALRVVQHRREHGARTHVYEFAHPAAAFDGALGAPHASDVAFAFDNLASDWDRGIRGDAALQSLADEMHGAFCAFARTGDPGWQPFGDDGTVRVLGAVAGSHDRQSVGSGPLDVVWDGVR